MKKLDKKQVPQFVALCILSAGVFGYFVVKIVTPSPAAAGTRSQPSAAASPAPVTPQAPVKSQAPETPPTSPDPAGTGKTGAVPPAPGAAEADAPPPTPGMRDPFVIGYVDPGTQPTPPAAPMPVKAAAPAKTAQVKAAAMQMASIHEVKPAAVLAPALPFGLKGFSAPGGVSDPPAYPKKAAPQAPAPPAWTVTGVLQGDGGQMAVLRSGEARRIVRTGDFVDSAYRVVAVTRGAVVLRHGTAFYHLTLGAAKPAGKTPNAPPPGLVPAPALTPAPAPVGVPQEDAQVPPAPALSLGAGLARMVQGALLMAASYMAPARIQTETCFGSVHVPLREDAQAILDQSPLDLGRDVYGAGQADGGAHWRCVAASEKFEAADGAEMQSARLL